MKTQNPFRLWLMTFMKIMMSELIKIMISIVDKPYSTIAMNRGITSPQELMKIIKCGFTLNCYKNKRMCKNKDQFTQNYVMQN